MRRSRGARDILEKPEEVKGGGGMVSHLSEFEFPIFRIVVGMFT